ncbi:MAG: neutral/alkaline non-lysosomal ceramidase N-terminal domain-containing protein [Cyclobacteriaceae bacterium]
MSIWKKKRTWILIALLLVVILFPPLRPIDRSDYHGHTHYSDMRAALSALPAVASDTGNGWSVGFGKKNITPHRVPTAGYGVRKGALFSRVHDSVYVRAMVFDNGIRKVAIVSADMLIIPPVITNILERRLPEIGFDIANTYLGATHTHNSIGTWGERLVGLVYSGSYSDSVVQFVANQVLESIRLANANIAPAAIRYGVVPVPSAVYNRMDEHSTVDPLLRVMDIERKDGVKLSLTSFTAHATCLTAEEMQLSRDYPGKLVDLLEQRGYTFAMFMAGAVGSHGPAGGSGWEGVERMATLLADAVTGHPDSLHTVGSSLLSMTRTRMYLGDPQFKISKDWRVAPYIFRTLVGEYPVYLTGLTVGDVRMLGAPCDFSGSLMRPLDSLALTYGNRAMVTSFNGGYVGYITCDAYYDLDYHETRIMNWYGPGNGAYFSECFGILIDRLAIADPARQ